MLNSIEELKLIRQAEKVNMTDSEQEALVQWALGVKLHNALLELIFDGYVDVDMMVSEPSFTLTALGVEAAGTDDIDDVINAILEDNWDNIDEDEDAEGYDYDNDGESAFEAVLALGKSIEEIKLKMQVLQKLCHKLGIELN